MIISLPIVFEFNDYIARTKNMCGKLHSQYFCNAFYDDFEVSPSRNFFPESKLAAMQNIILMDKTKVSYGELNESTKLNSYNMIDNTYIVSIIFPVKNNV